MVVELFLDVLFNDLQEIDDKFTHKGYDILEGIIFDLVDII